MQYVVTDAICQQQVRDDLLNYGTTVIVLVLVYFILLWLFY